MGEFNILSNRSFFSATFFLEYSEPFSLFLREMLSSWVKVPSAFFCLSCSSFVKLQYFVFPVLNIVFVLLPIKPRL